MSLKDTPQRGRATTAVIEGHHDFTRLRAGACAMHANIIAKPLGESKVGKTWMVRCSARDEFVGPRDAKS
jgi:hypothetical protein